MTLPTGVEGSSIVSTPSKQIETAPVGEAVAGGSSAGRSKVMDYSWMTAVASGPLPLGLAIAYALRSRWPLGSAERQRRKRTVERLYRNEPHPPERHSAR
jgi:hypothetical protein